MQHPFTVGLMPLLVNLLSPASLAGQCYSYWVYSLLQQNSMLYSRGVSCTPRVDFQIFCQMARNPLRPFLKKYHDSYN